LGTRLWAGSGRRGARDWGPGTGGVRRGVRSTEYRVGSTEYGVRSREAALTPDPSPVRSQATGGEGSNGREAKAGSRERGAGGMERGVRSTEFRVQSKQRWRWATRPAVNDRGKFLGLRVGRVPADKHLARKIRTLVRSTSERLSLALRVRIDHRSCPGDWLSEARVSQSQIKSTAEDAGDRRCKRRPKGVPRLVFMLFPLRSSVPSVVQFFSTRHAHRRPTPTIHGARSVPAGTGHPIALSSIS